jgi:geranylgeranyl diphosphate synthase type II
MAPGKRVRALLAMFVASHCGGEESAALSSACAIEMVHAASLIIDDLPSMDNASLRRGLPTNHCVFGEATAILASIALLNRAYGAIAEDDSLSAEQRVRLAEMLSWSVGSEGLVAGQEQDLKWQADKATWKDVALVHARKTAALFAAAAMMGAVTAAATEDQIALLGRFGERLGLAFQILDDLLDAIGSKANIGKDVGKDRGRPSLVLTVGLEAAWRQAQIYLDEASVLISNGGGSPLPHFAMGLVIGLESKLTPLWAEHGSASA